MTKKLVSGSVITIFLLVAGAAWSEEAAAPVAPAPAKAVVAEAITAESPAVEAAPAVDAETAAALAALFQSLSSGLQGPAPVFKACVANAGGCQCVGSCTGGGGCFCSADSCCSTCCASYRSQCC